MTANAPGDAGMSSSLLHQQSHQSQDSTNTASQRLSVATFNPFLSKGRAISEQSTLDLQNLASADVNPEREGQDASKAVPGVTGLKGSLSGISNPAFAHSIGAEQRGTQPDAGAEEDPALANSGLQDCVNPFEFPAWFFAEVELAGRLRTVAIFHVRTPSGLVPYWFEDPANQHRGLPLLKVMRPTILGDYGSILEGPNAMKIFVLIYKILNDLPDPLTCVQVIRLISRHAAARKNLHSNANFSGGNRSTGAHPDVTWSMVSEALNEVQKAMNDRREEFEMIMSYITGVAPMHHLSKS